MNNLEQRGLDATNRHDRIVDFKHVVEVAFLPLCEDLYWMQLNKEFRDLDYPTFYSYLHAPETNIDPTIAYMLIRVYKKFELELKVKPEKLIDVGYSKLDILISTVTEDNVDEWLAKATETPRNDLRIERDSGTTLYEENQATYRNFYVWAIMEDGFESLIKKFPEHKVDFILIREQFLKLKDKLEAQ